jgi:SAM-dependent methyltransferase
MSENCDVSYTARDKPTSGLVSNYESDRFTAYLRRYGTTANKPLPTSWSNRLVTPAPTSILDCPTGIGRWLPNLAALRPRRSWRLSNDVACRRKVALLRVDVELVEAVAEDVPFAEGQFDVVFCNALFKHLPKEVQVDITRELARVTRGTSSWHCRGNFGLPGFVRRVRKAKGAVAVSPSWAHNIFDRAGLQIVDRVKPSTPVGVEHS